MVMVIYSQRMQTRISKERDAWSRAQGEQAAAPRCPLLAEPYAVAHSPAMVRGNTYESFQPGMLTWAWEFRGLIGGPSSRHD